MHNVSTKVSARIYANSIACRNYMPFRVSRQQTKHAFIAYRKSVFRFVHERSSKSVNQQLKSSHYKQRLNIWRLSAFHANSSTPDVCTSLRDQLPKYVWNLCAITPIHFHVPPDIYIYIYAQVPRAVVVVVVVGTVAAVYRVCVCFDCTDRQTPDHLTICGNRVFDFTAKEMQSPLTFPAHRRPTQPGAPKPHFGYVCLSRWLS